jgi:formamidopyrimidine-DNA glycosylase
MPDRLVGTITKKEFSLLYPAIVKSLEKGLWLGGDSTSDYRNIYGEHGQSHHTHNVYRQTGKACTKNGCKGIIQRTVVVARGTHFCPKCQK